MHKLIKQLFEKYSFFRFTGHITCVITKYEYRIRIIDTSQILLSISIATLSHRFSAPGV